MGTRKFRKLNTIRKSKSQQKHYTFKDKSRKNSGLKKYVGGEGEVYTVVSEGTYGIIVTPAIKCDPPPPTPTIENYRMYVSKVFKEKGGAEEEYKAGKELKDSLGEGFEKYAILPVAECKITDDVKKSQPDDVTTVDGKQKFKWVDTYDEEHIIYERGGNDLLKEFDIPGKSPLDSLIARQNGPTTEPFKKLQNLLTGLKLLHEKGFCHGDFKAENCVVHEDTYKMIDLASVKKITEIMELHSDMPHSFGYYCWPTIACYSYFFSVDIDIEISSVIINLPTFRSMGNRPCTILSYLSELYRQEIYRYNKDILRNFIKSSTKYALNDIRSLLDVRAFFPEETTTNPTPKNDSFYDYILKNSAGGNIVVSYQIVRNLPPPPGIKREGTINVIGLLKNKDLLLTIIQYGIFTDCNVVNPPLVLKNVITQLLEINSFKKLTDHRKEFLRTLNFNMDASFFKYQYSKQENTNRGSVQLFNDMLDSITQGFLKIVQAPRIDYTHAGILSSEGFLKFINDSPGDETIKRLIPIFGNRGSGFADNFFETRLGELIESYKDTLGIQPSNPGDEEERIKHLKTLEFDTELMPNPTLAIIESQYKFLMLKYKHKEDTIKMGQYKAAYDGLKGLIPEVDVASTVSSSYEGIGKNLFKIIDLYSFGILLLESLSLFLNKVNKVKRVNKEDTKKKIIKYYYLIYDYISLPLKGIGPDLYDMATLYKNAFSIKTEGGGSNQFEMKGGERSFGRFSNLLTPLRDELYKNTLEKLRGKLTEISATDVEDGKGIEGADEETIKVEMPDIVQRIKEIDKNLPKSTRNYKKVLAEVKSSPDYHETHNKKAIEEAIRTALAEQDPRIDDFIKIDPESVPSYNANDVELIKTGLLDLQNIISFEKRVEEAPIPIGMQQIESLLVPEI